MYSPPQANARPYIKLHSAGIATGYPVIMFLQDAPCSLGIGISLHAAWALEISDHAAARLLQRAPNDDLRASAQQAALAFVAADASIVRPLIGTAQSIYLPTGSGAFAANLIGGMTQTGKPRIYARCRTFVPATWLKPDQVFLPRAADAENTVAVSLWQWNRIGEAILPVSGMSHRAIIGSPESPFISTSGLSFIFKLSTLPRLPLVAKGERLSNRTYRVFKFIK
jgi:hypothetical protein